MDARVYDGGKQYGGGDRYTVYLKLPNHKKRNCKILSSDKRVRNYNGLWIAAQPLGDDGVTVNTFEWLESGKNVMGFGKKIDLSTMPQYYQDWVKKVDKLWLAAWRVDTEEAWDNFYKSIG